MLTMYHVLNCLRIILSEVDDTCFRLAEAVATGSLEECGSSCDECSMYWVSFGSRDNGQI